MDRRFFNAHHSPIGAFASFTLGFPGRAGGLGLELGAPACQNVFIGAESRDGSRLEALPFFEGADDERSRFEAEGATGSMVGAEPMPLEAFPREAVSRAFRVASDTWSAGDVSFTVFNPVRGVPDPLSGDETALRQTLCPAVVAELTLDNRHGDRSRRAFLGYQGSDPYRGMRRLDDTTDGVLRGVGEGRQTGIATNDPAAASGQGFILSDVVRPADADNRRFGLPPIGAIVFEVEPGAIQSVRFAIAFYRDGFATSGIDTRYLYTRWFDRLEDAAGYALEHFDVFRHAAEQADAELDAAPLTEDQRFQLAHALRSYYGATMLLDEEMDPALPPRPRWTVHEGEYRMMNTFDLTVDMLFYELARNPWTVRNVLEQFIDRYQYHDAVRLPGDTTEYPGGVSFTHDMGIHNHFSTPGYSSYELFSLDGCFSHMTCEQLVNFILCSTLYAHEADDADWAKRHATLLRDCLTSLVHRDHPDPAKRDGVMSADAARTRGGAEITTYDSLDVSLGQARDNLYLAVKTWAAYVALERLFEDWNDAEAAATAGKQADRAASTIAGKMTPAGYIPAVMDGTNDSRIIPAIEGLVFPLRLGLAEALDERGRFASMLAALRGHLETVLVAGVCLFPDGGWKISSTSDNSWLSKIYLCQHVARRVFGMAWGEPEREADAAHVAWLLHEELSYWAWSDQIVAGRITASKYYPRGVTAWLWTTE